jgi:hypothetical protein
MDPDAALAELREFVAEVKEQREYSVGELETFLSSFAKHFEALDNWLKRGGFLPADWKKK